MTRVSLPPRTCATACACPGRKSSYPQYLLSTSRALSISIISKTPVHRERATRLSDLLQLAGATAMRPGTPAWSGIYPEEDAGSIRPGDNITNQGAAARSRCRRSQIRTAPVSEPRTFRGRISCTRPVSASPPGLISSRHDAAVPSPGATTGVPVDRGLFRRRAASAGSLQPAVADAGLELQRGRDEWHRISPEMRRRSGGGRRRRRPKRSGAASDGRGQRAPVIPYATEGTACGASRVPLQQLGGGLRASSPGPG